MTWARVTTGPSAGFGPVAVAAATTASVPTVVGSGCRGSETGPSPALAGNAATEAVTSTARAATSEATEGRWQKARRRRRLVAAVTGRAAAGSPDTSTPRRRRLPSV